MVKHFVIDGYNFAHKLGIKITKGNLQQVRNDVCRKVSMLASQKKCKATLVFDGRGVLGATEQYHNVAVVFTASGETADAYIKKMIDETPNKSALCVVSSDNEILRYAKVSRAQSMLSENFLKTATTSDSGKPTKSRSNASIKQETTTSEHKPSEVSASEVEEWKKLFK
ncbi:MAG: NYN domain-containing protein [Chloroherpetonaceae bacterium]